MVSAQEVKNILSRHLLTEGFDIIFDPERSRGSWLVDRRNGDRYLDFFSMYASMAVGFNHPRLLEVREQLGRLAVQKPANSDIYTETMAEFVETFARLAMPDYLPHLFFIEGGALAVENSLKAAFDWKVQKNFSRGVKKETGSQVIHFQQAFHGRTGYTLSLTNTFDPRKTRYFPKFDWPRIVNPKLTFPLDEAGLARVAELEGRALEQIEAAIERQGEDIAALIIEPVQGEGGDNHFRGEFLRHLRRICDDHEIMFILDEVQTGLGLTGRFWAHQHFDLRPDILCFGKKSQVCGIMASTRLDDNRCNVFTERSRINSTFGGNLIDMARCTRILRIIEEEKLVDNAAVQGKLLGRELETLARDFPALVANPRGLGLMRAFDAPDSATRDRLLQAFLREKLLLVGCGERSIRFRPHLVVKEEEILEGLEIIRRILKKGDYRGLPILPESCHGRGT